MREGRCLIEGLKIGTHDISAFKCLTEEHAISFGDLEIFTRQVLIHSRRFSLMGVKFQAVRKAKT